MSTLFDPFVTSKAHGLGIGLMIARTIIDAHDGDIGAHNNPEGGATFTITLRSLHRTPTTTSQPATIGAPLSASNNVSSSSVTSTRISTSDERS